MKHVYKIGKRQAGVWPTQSAVAHPEPRKLLKQQIASQTPLGVTGDGKQIYLYQNAGSSSVLRNRWLREIAFRAVGEGTGLLQGCGSLRFFTTSWFCGTTRICKSRRLSSGECGEIIRTEGVAGLYSATLFEYSDQAHPCWSKASNWAEALCSPSTGVNAAWITCGMASARS